MLNKFLSHFILILFLIIESFSGKAQYQKADINMPTPSAASLGEFGQTSISHYTGQPIIQVPLTELKSGKIAVPISLNYLASGVRPDQHPSWVGLNWNLNAGGMITRKVKDQPDEFNSAETVIKRMPMLIGTQLLSIPNSGYYYWRSNNDRADWANPDRIRYLVNVTNDIYDTEPDEFSFNFLGYSGKFYLSETGEWKVQSDQNIKVVFNNQNFVDVPTKLQVTSTKHKAIFCYRGQNIKSFGGFTLISEDGMQYTFGSNPTNPSTDAIEYSIPFFEQYSEHWTATTWYLVNIKSPQGSEIKFTYQPDKFISNMYVSFLWHVTAVYSGNNPYCGGYSAPQGTGENVTADWLTPTFASYLGHLLRPVYLAKIESDNVEIKFERSLSEEMKYPDFVYLKNKDIHKLARDLKYTTCKNSGPDPLYGYDPFYLPFPFLFPEATLGSVFNDPVAQVNALKWMKLSSISVVDKTDNFESYKFDFNFFESSSERLKLASVVRQNQNGQAVRNWAYTFEYNNNVALPSYFQEKTDHWGFLNNNNTKFFTAPRTYTYVTQLQTTNFDLIKAPATDLPTAVAGTIKKIVYPTGGSTEFEFEQNSYSQEINEARTGLATSSGTNAVAGGIRIKKIISREKSDGDPITKEYFYVNGFNGSNDLTSLPSSGILGGKSKYFWSNYDQPGTNNQLLQKTQIVSSQNILPGSYNSTGNHIGYSEVVEKTSNNGFRLMKFTNFFTDLGGAHFDEPSLPGSWTMQSPNNPYIDKSFERGKLLNESIYKNDGTLIKEIKREYFKSSDEFIKGLSLSANTYSCPNSTTFTGYVGFPYKVYTYKYLPLNEEVITYSAPGVGISEKTIYSHNSYNLPSEITKTQSKGTSKTVKLKYPFDLAAPGNIYQEMLDQYYINPAVIREEYVDNVLLTKEETIFKKWNSNSIQPETIKRQIGTNLPNVEISYKSYDSKGNLLQYDNKKQLPRTVIWGYNKSFPVAEVVNADPDEIAYTSFESDEQGGWGFGSHMITDAQSGVTGFKCYNLEGGVWKNDLISTKTYKVSFWVKGDKPGTNTILPNGTPSPPLGSNVFQLMAEKNGWKLFQGKISNAIGIGIWPGSSNTSFIDELRIYPENAQMITYTHRPLKGITSTCDINNRITYYEYDGFNRLELVRDFDNNIIKKICYNYRGQVEDCSINMDPVWVSTGISRCLTDANGNNTGFLEGEEKDINQRSSSYNNKRWVSLGQNTSICPIPVTCDEYTCSNNGIEYRCVYGACEPGLRVNTASYQEYDYYTGMWRYVCVYHYEWSDSWWSQDYQEYNSYPCPIY
jgi:hypothetical protein